MLIDIGANLSHESFRHDLGEVLERAREAGVGQLVLTGSTVEESRAARAIAETRPGMLFSTAGVHPHHAREWSEADEAALRELACALQVVAVGETGLDFYRDFSPRADQERVFEAHLELAAELAMPVFMHERDAHERFAAVLARHRHRLGNAVIHCFTGDAQALDAYLEMDLHVGITGWICDERRGGHLETLVGRIPLNRLMLETDAPYLLPRDLRPRPKSRRNEPMHLRHILDKVAACMGIEPATLAESTTRTARAFFDLPQPP